MASRAETASEQIAMAAARRVSVSSWPMRRSRIAVVASASTSDREERSGRHRLRAGRDVLGAEARQGVAARERGDGG
jgi:hypothetical protein